MPRPGLVWIAFVSSLFTLACSGSSNGTPSPAPNPSPTAPAGDTITLNAATTFQTIIGWEQPVTGTVLDYSTVLPFMSSLQDQAANDLGINKISIAVSAGVENPSGACQQQYLSGAITEAVFIGSCAYNSVNDNADPFAVNPDGFHFLLLDYQIDNILMPLKQRVEARGEKLYIQLRYVDFGASPFEHYQNPEEYAELMQVVFEHMNSRYGFTPDGIDVINEPALVAGWTPTAIGRVIARAGERLAARGFHPDFIGPSTADKANAVPAFDIMIGVAGAAQYLKDLSWHCYADNGSNSSATIGSRATQYNVRTSMSECWATSNTYQLLHQELKTSRNASWGLGILTGTNGLYELNTTTGAATPRPKAKFFRQYFKYIRAGAKRIDATSTNPALDPVAFVNADGRYVVVVKATGAGNFSIANLPAGTYGTFYTTGPDGLTVSSYDVNAADKTITAGQTLSASIPGTGVITVYAKTRTAGDAPAFAGGISSTPTSGSTSAGRSASNSDAVPQWQGGATIVTQDGIRLRLEQIAGTVADPTDLAFTPDSRIFVAEREGRIRVVREGSLVARPAWPLLGGSDDEQFLSIAVDPRFERTHYVYTLSTTPAESGRQVRLARFREASDTLADRIILLDGIALSPDAAAASMRFGPDGKLFVAFDDAGSASLSEDLASPNGKILRLNPDGTTPNDQRGNTPLFSYAYHSPHGLDWHPTAHTLWIADREGLDSTRLDVVATGEEPRQRGVHRAALALPAGSPAASLAFYRSNAITAMRDNLFVASDEGRHLLRLQLDPGNTDRVVATERMLQDMVGGIRVVGIGPDGAIYFGTANALGRLVRDSD